MLWEPDRHEALIDEPWDADAARVGIRELAADAERAYDETTLWPPHSLDEDGASKVPWTSLYCGASGVAWALDQLQRRGALTAARDWRAEARRFVDIHLAFPETGEATPSLMLGEVGVRAIADLDHDRLYALIESNIEHESLEMLWGGPGTMLPALFLFERTGEERWRELYVRNAQHLLRTLEYHADYDVWMWTQNLYGERVRLLGAGHGFAGNMFSLLRGAALLSDEQRALIAERAAHTLRAVALCEGPLANWLPHVGQSRREREKILVQWCHGAPGMILGLSRLPPEAEVDALFVAAAELVWRAGPLAKGAGICHGTAGNGYAFLAMHARTGDPQWLDRARRFAMHALAQARSAAREYGRGRYSLWTGDVGVALFLQDCIDGAGELPSVAYL
ncbi:MAG: lanthionine synthetase [Kofleriaceae bacterium]|nr:lanthionine synthetase [Kofleriaceae bacterium]